MAERNPFTGGRTVVGMVHLRPLPGAPRYRGDRAAVREAALDDAAALEAGGVDAVLVENFGDVPYFPDRVPPHVVASMTTLVDTVSAAVDVPVGVNVLQSDGLGAVSVAAATDAAFVRVNVHVGARVTDQGVVEGGAHEVARLREQLDTDVRVFADVDPKHSAPLAEEPVEGAVADAVERGLADGVIVTGSRTGRAVELTHLESAVEARDDLGVDAQVLVGSGVTADSIGALLGLADGVIVGTAMKRDGVTTNPVDTDRVAALVEAART